MNNLGHYYPLNDQKESITILKRFLNNELYTSNEYEELMNYTYNTYEWNNIVDKYIEIIGEQLKINKDTKILITGCGGMLGAAFYQYYSQICTLLATDIDLNEDWLSHLDVRDSEEIKTVVTDFNPDMIFHLAALTDLEYCDTNPDESYLTNTIGTENIANICEELNIPMLYICTAGFLTAIKSFMTIGMLQIRLIIMEDQSGLVKNILKAMYPNILFAVQAG